ncbi:MAG: hypothetical protein LIO45_06630, partial [Clostridiales bacterium]|nr:hypothetical protein [Clostridiales bacterium]
MDYFEERRTASPAVLRGLFFNVFPAGGNLPSASFCTFPGCGNIPKQQTNKSNGMKSSRKLKKKLIEI